MFWFCCFAKQTWKLQLEVLSEEGKLQWYAYKVRIQAKNDKLFPCFYPCRNNTHSVRVNGMSVEEEDISTNMCFPFCCSGGEVEWQDKGHFFRIEFPSLFLQQRHTLFVNGTEVHSRRSNAAQWKCQFVVWICIGAFVFVAGLLLIAVYQSKCCGRRLLFVGISSLVTGVITMLPGIVGLVRAAKLDPQRVKKVKKKVVGTTSMCKSFEERIFYITVF